MDTVTPRALPLHSHLDSTAIPRHSQPPQPILSHPPSRSREQQMADIDIKGNMSYRPLHTLPNPLRALLRVRRYTLVTPLSLLHTLRVTLRPRAHPSLVCHTTAPHLIQPT